MLNSWGEASFGLSAYSGNVGGKLQSNGMVVAPIVDGDTSAH